MIKNLFLELFYPGWILFAVTCFLVIFVFFYYHKSLPPLTKLRRLFLTILRSLTLTIILLLLFQPILNIVYEKKELPTVAILIDNSVSMSIQEEYGKRSDSLKFILDQINLLEDRDSVKIKPYFFSDKLTSFNGDSLNFTGKQTDIFNALVTVKDSLSNQNLKAIILMSDGLFNQGMNPLRFPEKYQLPVYTVGLGSTSSQKDIWISDVRVKQLNYAGEEFPLQLRVMQNGFSNEEITLRLYQANKFMQAKKVRLPEAGFEKEIIFPLKADKPGEFQYSINIDSPEDEMITQNNNSSFLVKILRSKIRALLFSGQPSFDQKVLAFCLKRLPDIEFSSLTERSGGRYYEKNFAEVAIDSQDVFLLLGFPTGITNEPHLQKIYSTLGKADAPLFLFLNQSTDLSKLIPLEKKLPIEIPNRTFLDQNISAQLTGAAMIHPVTQIGSNPQNLQTIWKDLPPLSGLGRQMILKKNSTVLFEYEQANTRSPLLIAAVLENMKSLLFTGVNFYPWHYQLQNDIERNNILVDFLGRALKWLVNREDIQRIQIQPNKKVYKLGEPIRFLGQVFDEFYEAIEDANVEISITGKNINRKDLLPSENGYYSYEIPDLVPGDYNYQISVTKNDQSLGVVRGKFLVEEFELELQVSSANLALLREMAEKSSGKFWSAKEVVENLGKLKFSEHIYFNTITYNLWDKYFWLMILTILLSLEWFFRKRWGLL